MFEKITTAKFVRTLTFNYDDDHQYISNVCRLTKVIDTFRALMKHLAIKYECYTELSYPQKSMGGQISRVHFHGIILFDDEIEFGEFYLSKFHILSKYSIIEVDTIKDNQIWFDYCTKDKSVMQPLIEEYGHDYKMTHDNYNKNNKSYMEDLCYGDVEYSVRFELDHSLDDGIVPPIEIKPKKQKYRRK